MNFLQRFCGHFNTITTHRHRVIINCFKAGIFWQGLKHDLSKYSPTEFLQGVKYYQGHRSPNEAEREDIGYSTAWMHHKGRNRHHFEYWNDYNPKTRTIEAVPMPKRYIVEMFCDRVAASQIYNKASYNDDMPLAYYRRGNAGKRMIHKDTAKDIEMLLEMLSNKGEKETFRYIREEYNR